MRNVSIACLLLGLLIPAKAQLDSESIPPELDQRDLYARAAASQVVIIGLVVKSEGALPRLLPGESSRWRSSSGRDRRAGLYTVQVDETVCRQTDFDSAASKVDSRPQPFYLLIPFDESDLPEGDFREAIVPGRRYLLLLTELDSRALSATYELDPNRIYYRGTGHNRGVIPFEPQTLLGHNPPEVVDKFRRLCDAMRPSKPEDKLALLQQLADSGDPVLEREAKIAMNAVKASRRAKPQAVLPTAKLLGSPQDEKTKPKE